MSLVGIEEFREAGVILVDKPQNWTSFDIVAKIRNLTGAKIGHAGTLDPLATGLVILCSGKKTKSIESFMGLDKLYSGKIQLGSSTESYDLETEPTNPVSTEHISLKQVQDAAQKFLGEIQQLPPKHSAVRKGGKRLYEYARKGQDVKIDPRTVRVDRFEVSMLENGEIEFEIKCSKGTYIRSLAHDLGQALGVGGYLSFLRREAIGDYNVKDAFSMDEIIQHFSRLKQEIKDDKK